MVKKQKRYIHIPISFENLRQSYMVKKQIENLGQSYRVKKQKRYIHIPISFENLRQSYMVKKHKRHVHTHDLRSSTSFLKASSSSSLDATFSFSPSAFFLFFPPPTVSMFLFQYVQQNITLPLLKENGSPIRWLTRPSASKEYV